MTAQTILPANSVTDTGYNVDNSVRFNSGDNCKISRTSPNSSPTNAKRFTISFWVKRSNIDAGSGHEHQQIFDSNDGSEGPNIQFQMYFTQNTLRLQTYNGSNKMELVTNRLFRDISAWYSIIFSYDSTPSTPSASSVRLWINGVLETSFSTAVYPSQNTDGEFAIQNDIQMIGNNTANTRDLGGYLAEVIGVDGQALVNTDFGEFDEDSGIFKPIDVSGIDVGTLGFYLDFEDSSALGNDVSGVGDFTLANLAAIDQSTDTCTNNFSTLNPLDVGDKDGRTLSNGNLDFTTSSGNNGHISGTLAVSGSGKWYFETKILAQSGTASSSAKFGIIGIRNINESSADVAGNSYYVYSDGRKEDGDNTTNSAHPGYVLNDIVQVALDLDNGNVYFGLNGDWGDNDGNFDEAFGNATAFFTSINTGGFWSAYLNKNVTADNVLTLSANFGSPSFAISSGNTDGNGYGNFEYAVPSGYFALCTKNLAEYGG